jgi:tetratricopeptide (TPR) repeat protein
MAFEIDSSLGDDAAAARDLMGIGNAHSSSGENSLAAEFYKQALEKFQKVGFQEGLAGQAQALDELGVAYRWLSDYGLSKKYLKQSLELYSKLKEPQPNNATSAKEDLASVYADQGDYALAVALYREVRPTLLDLGYKAMAAWTALNWGSTLFDMGNQTEAFKKYELSRTEFQETEDKNGEAWVLAKLAQWYIGKHLCDEGLKYADQSLTLAKALNDESAKLMAGRYKARAYLCAKSLQEAEVEAQHALEGATRLKNGWAQAYNLETLALVAEAEGDIQRAVEYAEKSVALWDSISSRTVYARSARANLARWKERLLRARSIAEAQLSR